MSLKSILRALGLARPHSGPQSLGDAVRGITPQPTPFLDRLTARRDWNREPLPIDPVPQVAPWDRAAPLSLDGDGVDLSGRGPDLWPPQDDPYAKPEPCDVVPDDGKATIDRLASRGLLGPLQSIHGVTDLIDKIERQEMAEKILTERFGWYWDRENKIWTDPT